MVTYLRILKLITASRCLSKGTFLTNIMSKRSLQISAENKSNKGLINSDRNFISTGHNLNINTQNSEKMQAEVDIVPANEAPIQISRIRIEYLPTPVKSKNDKKHYRVIQLENGLTALLISDMHSHGCASEGDQENDEEATIASASEEEDERESDDDEDDDEDDEEDGKSEANDDEDSSNSSKKMKREEKMAACGLSVGVGSFSDPPEILGMAHFLEHMVFMGSEKYPQENDFDAFTKKQGGNSNATTDCEQTTFYFEIQEKHLLASLDRFAQFFIKPLMKKDAITREREAVESEFQMTVHNDSCRKEQLFCTFARPNHPARKFSCGNLKTLRDNIEDEKLYEELHKFRERHYSAHRMKVAIQARLPLEDLENYVVQCFANVPNNELPPKDFSQFKGAESFDTTNFRRIYKIKPVKDVCQVDLAWSMPSLRDLYKSKPHQYVSWIIGHEGKGSLVSYLRKKMWCLEMYSGNSESGFDHSSLYALFSLTLVLTDEGHKHLEEVLNATFAYINMVRREGPQKRIYDEIHQIAETNFRFAEEDQPIDNVESLCEDMHYYPPRDYIAGDELYYEYNPEAIQTCMNYLSADNVNIMILDKKFNDEEFDKVEPWYNTKYTDTDIPKSWTETWKTIEPFPEFHLPLPNIYLTDDFSLIPIPNDVPKYPVKVHSDDVMEIWYRPDPKFRLPECYMYIYLVSPMAVSSPKNAALMGLFVGILKQLLVEELYPATVAQLSHEFNTGDKGIIIKVYGYNQKLPILLTTIAKYIANYSALLTKDLFDVMKKQLIKEYYNTFLKPSKVAKDVRLSILMLVHWPATDKHAALVGVEYQEFENFVKNFTNHIYIQSLIQGNMTEENAVKNVQNCVETLKCGAVLPNTMPQFRIAQMPLGSYYCKVKNFNKEDTNSVVTNYYQSGVFSIELSVVIELLIMIMEEPLFNQLRTLEHLGYSVFCLLRDSFGILGYSVTVCTQADKFTTEHADERIEKFLEAFKTDLGETSDKVLDGVKEALIKLKQCADVHLRQEVGRNWGEITSNKYMFDQIEKEVAAIEKITISQLIEFIKNHTLAGSNLRKLSVHVIGTAPEVTNNANDIPESEMEVDSSHKSESQHALYPLKYVSTKDPKMADAHYITDLQDFKKNLYIYPTNYAAL